MSSMKKCSKCGVEKGLEWFDKSKVSKDGFRPICKGCVRAYREATKERIAENKKDYYEANKDRFKDYREANKGRILDCHKAYREANKERILEYNKEYNSKPEIKERRNKRHKERRQNDIQFKLAQNLRHRLHTALKNKSKVGSAVRDLGCTIEELVIHLESMFQPGMTWDNWTTDGWHVDHKRPLASFDLTDREQFLQACHYTNLQPLWAEENLSKSDNYDPTIFVL